MKPLTYPSLSRLVRRAGIACAAVGLSLSAATAFADVVEEDLKNPEDETDVWGKKITGLGTGGDETALVFTKTGATMVWTLPDRVSSIRYLVVGGGGSGGNTGSNAYGAGGGGGAGGVLTDTHALGTPGGTLSVTVGIGGVTKGLSQSQAVCGTKGGNSTLKYSSELSLTAEGGGGGCSPKASGNKNGGCGGGGSAAVSGSKHYVGGTGSQGNNGGSAAVSANATTGMAAGGGGMGSAGADAVPSQKIAGNGGDGIPSSITGTEVYYAAGGGGGARQGTAGAGGNGGGGKGGKASAGSAATGFGCGGGGSGSNGSSAADCGGNGYQGIVIVRYQELKGDPVAVPTITNAVYNGMPQKADVADTDDYEVTQNEGGTDAGTYDVVLTLKGTGKVWADDGTTAPKTLAFVIEKAANAWVRTPSLSKTTWTLDDDPATVDKGEAVVGVVDVTYDAGVAEMPTELGSHTAFFAVAESVNYLELATNIPYTVTKHANGWAVEPVVPKTFNVEDPVPDFVAPTAIHGNVYGYYDGDTSITEPPTDLGNHTVTYKVDEGDEYLGYEKTYSYSVTYKPIADQTDLSKVCGYRLTGLGSGDEVALVFTNTTGTMTFTLPQYVTEVSYLVVGGGAGGGACSGNWYTAAGGGGGGAVLTNTLAISDERTLTVAVGKSGAGSTGSYNRSGNGGKSSLRLGAAGPLEALGGGGGGSGHNTAGANGGCGGGGSYTGVGGTGTGGYDGGKGGCATSTSSGGGGGGGGASEPGAAGSAASPYLGGKGGEGIWSAILGSDVCYGSGGSAGNGGQSSADPVAGGTGAGKGGYRWSMAGGHASNFGCGGGGAYNGGVGGNGGQGIVVVRYVEDPLVAAVPGIAAKPYTGEEQTADVPASHKYTVTANEGGTDVGEYVVTLALEDGYTWDGGSTEPTNLVFAITQAQNVWTVEPSISKESWLTTDEPGVLTNGETRFGEVTRVIVKDGGAAEPFVALPTKAGTYVITNIAPETTANYLTPAVTEKTVAFTIFGAGETPDFTVTRNGAIAVGEADGVVTAAVPYRVACDVVSSKRVNVYALVTPEGADTPEEVTLAEDVALDAAGFGVLDDLVPGTNYWVALYGLGVDDGKSSPTTDAVRVTTLGPAKGLTAAATYTNDPKEFVISGSVTPGLGTTTVYLRWSLNSDALDNAATYTFAYGDAGAFSTNVPYAAISDTLTWAVAVSNSYASTTYGALAWNDTRSATTTTRKDTKTTTYTWNGNGGDNCWTNVANWSADRTPCYGYPDGDYAKANVWSAQTLDLGGVTNTIAGLGLSANRTVTVTNGTLAVPRQTLASNTRLTAKDGGKVYLSAADILFAQNGSGAVMELAGDATYVGYVRAYTYSEPGASKGNMLYAHGTNNVVNGTVVAQDGTLTVRVENGELKVNEMMVWGSRYPLVTSVSNGTVSVDSFVAYNATCKNNPRRFEIFIPANGLAAAPIAARQTVDGARYGLGTGTSVKLTCDAAFVGGKVPLIAGVKTIDLVSLAAKTEVPDGYTVEYSLEEGVLYAKLHHNGFIFFVK